MTTVAIVGAGPAGLAAAEQLVAAGLRPVLIDEQPQVGGQIHRRPPSPLMQAPGIPPGSATSRALSLLQRWDSLGKAVDHRADTLVWHIEDRTLHLLAGGRRPSALPFDALILAAGATDRVLPFPGWTLPGVFTLGAAQVMLKAQAALLGPRIVFAGTGPLLILVAAEYVRTGAPVQAVLDVAPAGTALRAARLLAACPGRTAHAARLLTRLALAGVAVHRGVTLLGAEPGGCGDGRVVGLHWRRAGRDHLTPCDAIAFGHGLRSETQLADLAGCAFGWDPIDAAWVPLCDEHGRSSVAGVYLAGDGAAIRGADAAALAGVCAAQAALADLGVRCASSPVTQETLRGHERWRRAMHAMSPLPPDWAARTPDDVVVCRCEEITAGELRSCVRDTGARDLNRLKALTRLGMGRCQGRMCGAAAARLLAQATGARLSEVGRLRGQPPVKPVPVVALASVAGLATDAEVR